MYLKDIEVCSKDTGVYLKDTEVCLKDTEVYLKDTEVYSKDTWVYLKDIEVYLTETWVYSKDTGVYLTETQVYLRDTGRISRNLHAHSFLRPCCLYHTYVAAIVKGRCVCAVPTSSCLVSDTDSRLISCFPPGGSYVSPPAGASNNPVIR